MSEHFLDMNIEQLRAEVLGLERDNAALLAACKNLFDLNPEWSGSHDAPGHNHFIKGVWDESGEECDWCKAWFHFVALVGQSQQL